MYHGVKKGETSARGISTFSKQNREIKLQNIIMREDIMKEKTSE